MPRSAPTLRQPGADEMRARDKRQRQRVYDRQRGSAHKRGYDRRWSRYASGYLQRSPLCVQCAEEDVDRLAECVDHIRPVEWPDDPGFWDAANHQPLCWSCHSRKTVREDGGFRGRVLGPELVFPPDLRPSRPPLSLVCGPPGAGKSTWVRAQAGPDDEVIDLDAICAEVSGTARRGWPLDIKRRAMQRRNAMLRGLAESDAPRAWFIVTGGQGRARERWAKALGAGQIVLVVAQREECVRRIMADEDRAPVREGLVRAVDDWLAGWHCGLGERVVRTDQGVGG